MLSNLFIFLLLFLVSCKQNDGVGSVELLTTIGFISLFFMLFVASLLFSRARINRIKKIYDNTKKHLHFWDKLDRIKLETMLQKNKLPEDWLIKLNKDKNKIEDIYFYDGQSVGRIAQDKEKLFNSFRRRIKNN